MSDDHRRRLQELIDAARALPPDERSRFLAERSPDDSTLRAEVEAQLAAEDTPTISSRATRPDEGPGHEIGPYKLLDILGEGGMGTVYLARQQEPIARRVALKIIKLGMDTRQVVARFEAERQTLALMDHPNIARVLDAGATAWGRPYFVMEYVPGIPITRFCDQEQLDHHQRLGLFVQVCDAIQHAHQKGIVHRDIKATNILVMLHDDRPVPKVIDFGIAHATAQHLTSQSVYTQKGEIVGTFEYMSPEQTEMTGLEIDARTDIYSLGVLLYELLTGTLPFDSGRLRGVGLDEVLRIIREQDPAKPSTRISALGPDTALALKARRTDIRTLRRRLRGDLDWITMKAMEKSRSRRYASASGLAADIERHLSNEPVLAGPPSTAYRLGKFVRRHRMGVIAAAIVTLALVAGVVGMTVGLFTARAQRDIAVAARQEADRQRDNARATTAFMIDVLGLANPEVTLDPTFTIREMLDKAAVQVKHGLTGQPEAEAAVRTTIGRAYLTLGEYELAEEQLVEALATRRRLFGNESAEVFETMWPLMRIKLDRQDDDLLTLSGELVRLGPKVIGKEQPALGAVLWRMFEEARDESTSIPLVEETIATARRTLAAGDPLRLVFADMLHHCGLGFSLLFDNRPAARLCFEESLRIKRQELPGGHPDIARTLAHLAATHDRGSEEAVQLVREALAIRRHSLPPGHWLIGSGEVLLGRHLAAQGRFEAAERLLLGGIEVLRSALGSGHIRLTFALEHAIDLYQATDHPERGRPFALEIIEVYHALATKRQGIAEDQAEDLNRHSWELLTCKYPDLRDPVQALQIAEKAVRLSGGSVPHILDTQALACYQTGDTMRAIEIQKRAIAVSDSGNAAFRDEYVERLEAMRRGEEIEP